MSRLSGVALPREPARVSALVALLELRHEPVDRHSDDLRLDVVSYQSRIPQRETDGIVDEQMVEVGEDAGGDVRSATGFDGCRELGRLLRCHLLIGRAVE